MLPLADNRVRAAAHHVGRVVRCGRDRVPQRAAGDGGAGEVERVGDLAHQARNAAGVVEVLHVVRAGGLQVDEHRAVASQPSKTS